MKLKMLSAVKKCLRKLWYQPDKLLNLPTPDIIDGVGASLALVGMAKQIEPEEKDELISEITSNASLSFRRWVPEIVRAFQKYAKKLKSGSPTSKEEVMNAIRKIPAGSAIAGITIATCICTCITGTGEGFDENECRAVAKLCKMLGGEI